MKYLKFLLIILIALSCEDDKPIDIDPFSDIALDNIKNYIPINDLEANTAIEFVNQVNDSKILMVKGIVEYVDKTLNGESYKTESIYYQLSEENNSSYSISIQAEGIYNEPGKPIQLLVVAINTNLTTPELPWIDIFEDGLTLGKPRSDLDLLDKNFIDVISNVDRPDTPSSFSKLYYNFEYGVVGFHDINNELWVFKEYTQ